MPGHPSFWGTGFHYNATVMPIMFLAAIDAMARISARSATSARSARSATSVSSARPAGSGRERPAATGPGRAPPGPAVPVGTAVTRLGATAMVVAAVGLAFSFPLSHLWRPWTYVISPQVRAEEAAMAQVPDGVTVEASETMLAPLAARDDTSWIKNRGISDPRYIVIRAARHRSRQPPARVLRFVEAIHPGAVYRQVFKSGDVYVFRRVASAWQAGRDPAARAHPPGVLPAP